MQDLMSNISGYLTEVSVLSYLVVFAGGVLTSFTPCIYPLIPIIVGVIGASKEKSPGRNFLLSLSYVFGMAIIFSILGLAASLTGRLFGQVQSNPVVHLAVGGAIILFALALLDVVPMPTFFLSRAGAGKVVKRGGFFSAFLMGLISGFIAAPCTSAVLGALLVYVGAKGNPVFGFTLLITFAVGLGTILVIIGTFAGVVSKIPRSERAMVIFQKVLAFGMIFLGAYFIYKAGILSV